MTEIYDILPYGVGNSVSLVNSSVIDYNTENNYGK